MPRRSQAEPVACHEGRRRSPSVSGIGEKTDFLTFQLNFKNIHQLSNNADKLINANGELGQRPRLCIFSWLVIRMRLRSSSRILRSKKDGSWRRKDLSKIWTGSADYLKKLADDSHVREQLKEELQVDTMSQ